jgi:hypothetical protein
MQTTCSQNEKVIIFFGHEKEVLRVQELQNFSRGTGQIVSADFRNHISK